MKLVVHYSMLGSDDDSEDDNFLPCIFKLVYNLIKLCHRIKCTSIKLKYLFVFTSEHFCKTVPIHPDDQIKINVEDQT